MLAESSPRLVCSISHSPVRLDSTQKKSQFGGSRACRVTLFQRLCVWERELLSGSSEKQGRKERHCNKSTLLNLNFTFCGAMYYSNPPYQRFKGRPHTHTPCSIQDVCNRKSNRVFSSETREAVSQFAHGLQNAGDQISLTLNSIYDIWLAFRLKTKSILWFGNWARTCQAYRFQVDLIEVRK